MGNTFGRKTIIDFGKCVKPQTKMPLLARIYIVSINKMLNISPHVSLGSVMMVIGLNVYHVKMMDKREKMSN